MRVRTWVTISALALVALTTAVAFQFLRPIEPPVVVVHVGEQRIAGTFGGACWPQRTGVLRCTKGKGGPSAQTIPRKGTTRIVLASPAQPRDGIIRITDAATGKTVLRRGWQRTVRYELHSGTYTLTAQAGDSDKAYVRYLFKLRVR